MAITYPTTLDALSNPAPADPLTGHAAQHANVNDAIEAIEVKVGITGSADTASLDYKAAAATAHIAASAPHAGHATTGHTHDATYAPIAKGVTNGDAHDHAGGDGAQIAYAGLSGLPTLGSAAALDVGTTAGTVAAGDDARLSAETTTTIGALINGATAKTTPVDADQVGLMDSEASNLLKKFSWSALKTALQSVFAALAGKAGGQTLFGGTAASETLTLRSTAHATKGNIILGTLSAYDEVLARLGIGTTAPSAQLHALSTTEQLRLGYDASQYETTTVNSAGVVARTTTGGQWTYKAGTSSATLGPELITNGAFTSNLSGWTDAGSSWSWSAGTALHTAGSVSTLTQQNVAVTNGSTYQVEVTITGRSVGSIAIALGSVSVIDYGTSTALIASLKRPVVAGASGNVDLVISPSADFDGAIDWVSIKVITLNSVTPVVIFLDSSGSAALEYRSISAGLQSHGIGISTHRSLTSGSYDTAFGCSAQRSLITGNFNNAFGAQSQYSLTSGNYNNAFGSISQYSLTVGGYNNSVGYSSQYAITTGSSNDAIGYSSQRNLTTGASNNAIGHSSQYLLNSGSYNNAIGHGSQYSLTSGSYNCAIGYYSQYSATTGIYNVSIGRFAQRYIADGVTGAQVFNNCTHIGVDTRISAENANNETVIGYLATGIGSNTVALGNLNVTRTGLRGSVEILASSSTTASQTQGALAASWTDSTHATRKARLTLSAYDTAAREGIRIEGDGTVARLGFYGATAVIKPTALTATVAAAPAGGTGTAAGAWDTAGNRDLAIATINNLKTRVDQLESKLQALGLLT